MGSLVGRWRGEVPGGQVEGGGPWWAGGGVRHTYVHVSMND